MKKIKIFNDPIYGFIHIPNDMIFTLIEHPYLQRLRRISQLGLSYLVYPGAHHTRFHHVLGCVYLMQKAVAVLRNKGIEISDEESEALQIAILLHDVGHGPFSHALEESIVNSLSHEAISLMIMNELNEQFEGKLDLAIAIFSGKHPKKFFHELISSQLDMDRMDFLKRDSFYSGVAEGNINADRLISMLHVKNDRLVIEEKGVYSVEKFIVSRRFLYWQVYLHKTGVAAEQVMINILKRARELAAKGENLQVSPAFHFFLENAIEKTNFTKEILQKYLQLDDFDILSALKSWTSHPDFVLSYLSASVINRRLPKIEMQNQEFDTAYVADKLQQTASQFKISKAEAKYLVFGGKVQNKAYNLSDKGIDIMKKNGEVIDLIEATDQLNLKALSKPVTKYFLCYPK